MKDVLVLIDEPNDHEDRIRDAVRVFNGSQKHYRLIVSDKIKIPDENGRINHEHTRQFVASQYPRGAVLCITSKSFTDNWFSHDHRNCSLITTADWEECYSPPSLKIYLLYQFAQALLILEADLSEQMILSAVHEPPVGCVGDFCQHKADIRLGMIAGNICPQCEGSLLRYGISRSILESTRSILDVVRAEATGRPRIVDFDEAFVIMRFSANDENDNAYRYGLRKGLEDVGLRPRRADDSLQSIQILDKVVRQIERSRCVVAKVDTDNLNVYFELGVAMGLQKDVLLVSESSLVLSLPSDLRNWECLTYGKGNYEELRSNVSTFYREQFGFGV